MERYMDLLRETVEATLAPGPMSLTEIHRAVSTGSRVPPGLIRARPPQVLTLSIVLMLNANPDRFVEVSPGVWARRGNGPDAGVPSQRPRRPLVGSAAAAAQTSKPAPDVDAVAPRRLVAG